jgi:hypothetical protein
MPTAVCPPLPPHTHPQTRQRLGFKKGEMFEPTPNVRNPHMMEVSVWGRAGTSTGYSAKGGFETPSTQSKYSIH